MNPYVSALLGLLTLCWGMFVFNPFDDAFDSAAIYGKAMQLAPEEVWGSVAFAIGAYILLSIYFTRAYHLARALKLATWFWFLVSFALWLGDWHNTGGLTYFFVGLYAVTAFLNIKVNYVKQGIHRI